MFRSECVIFDNSKIKSFVPEFKATIPFAKGIQRTIEWMMDEIDLILVMSINPGFGGQSFMTSQLKKIERLRAMIDATGRDIPLEVDGGVNAQNIADIARAGADTFVAGSAIFGSPKDTDANRYNTVVSEMRASLATVK